MDGCFTSLITSRINIPSLYKYYIIVNGISKKLRNSNFQYNPPPHNGLDILHIDSDLIIVNKPSGILSVPGRGEDKQDCMISRVNQEYPGALTIHRLDMETSGILIIARNEKSQSAMGKLFQSRNIKKQYIALVNGIPKKNNGLINFPLIADWPNRPKQKIDLIKGKPSSTNYLVIESTENASRVKLTPITGRSHQLRVHMLAIGHPILGDRLYASQDIIDRADRLLLHASFICFNHPITHEKITIKCPEPY